MRIAAFGDIHGNIFALQAVLKDVRTQSPDGMVVFGDLVYKLPWGREVVDLLRTLPLQPVIGNSEIYLALWGTSLWPAERWNSPLAREEVQRERARLGSERLAWLAALPEHAAYSGTRPEDLLVVHGVPGNPFLPLLDRPGHARPPWIQTDVRAAQLLNGVEPEVLLCGHTHSPLRRWVSRGRARGTLIVNPGGLSYARGPTGSPHQAHYALLDWSRAGGWTVTFRIVEYDEGRLRATLRTLREDDPLVNQMVRQMRTPHESTPDELGEHFRHYRWGDAPEWWEQREHIPAWRALRGLHEN
jgi:predicted phosphodiesterase